MKFKSRYSNRFTHFKFDFILLKHFHTKITTKQFYNTILYIYDYETLCIGIYLYHTEPHYKDSHVMVPFYTILKTF